MAAASMTAGLTGAITAAYAPSHHRHPQNAAGGSGTLNGRKTSAMLPQTQFGSVAHGLDAGLSAAGRRRRRARAVPGSPPQTISRSGSPSSASASAPAMCRAGARVGTRASRASAITQPWHRGGGGGAHPSAHATDGYLGCASASGQGAGEGAWGGGGYTSDDSHDRGVVSRRRRRDRRGALAVVSAIGGFQKPAFMEPAGRPKGMSDDDYREKLRLENPNYRVFSDRAKERISTQG